MKFLQLHFPIRQPGAVAGVRRGDIPGVVKLKDAVDGDALTSGAHARGLQETFGGFDIERLGIGEVSLLGEKLGQIPETRSISTGSSWWRRRAMLRVSRARASASAGSLLRSNSTMVGRYQSVSG